MHTLSFINHSGFVLELENAVLVFDYYTDPALVLSRYEESQKPFYFFVSHSHFDHWNPDILSFDFPNSRTFFLDKDCEIPEDFEQEESDRFYQTYPSFYYAFSQQEQEETSLISVRAFASTDAGCSYLLETKEGFIFHAGDLNFWDWEEEGKTDELMENAYRTELEKIKEIVGDKEIFLVMLAVDFRLGQKAFLGAEVFLEYFQVNYLVPDHLNGGLRLPKELDQRLAGKTKVLSMTSPGASIHL